MAYQVDDTIVAIASAAGGAARGVIRLSGPAAISCLKPCFRSDEAIPINQARCIVGSFRALGPIGDVDCETYVWPTERSYTRQPSVEIHMVGSPPVLQATLKTLCQHGARLAEPGEFTLRAFLAGRLDLPQAEAVLGIIDATTQKQLDSSLTQLAGGLSQQLNQLRDLLLNLCADIEAGLDFVDEDIEFVTNEQVTHQLEDIRTKLKSLLQQVSERGSTNEMPRVVLHGRPNAGKSTLWNTLVQRESAITSEIPGTTRDYLEADLDWEGLKFRLIDTAGMDSEALSDIDDRAREMTIGRRREADVVILCIDGSMPRSDWDRDALEVGSADVVLITKADTLAPSGTAVAPIALNSKDGRQVQAFPISCHQSKGIAALQRRIREAILEAMMDESGVVMTTAVRCRESLRLAKEDIGRALDLASMDAGNELIAAEIRNALTELGKVVGAVYTEDVLDRVFSRFCIGK